MTALAAEVVTTSLLAGFVIVATLFVTRTLAYLHRHHPAANRRFMARYRANQPSRTTADAPASRTSPQVRPHNSAGVGGAPPTPTPAEFHRPTGRAVHARRVPEQGKSRW